MLHKRTSWTRIAAAGAMLAALLLGGCGLLPREVEEAPVKIEPPPKTDKASYAVKKGSITDKVSLRAVFAPVQSADLFYKNGGRLKAIYVKAGDKVEAGQLLAELYADDANYQLAKARIQYEKAQIAMADGRSKAQFKGEAAVEGELRRLELELESARLDLERYSALVADTRLVAPFTGVITSVDAKPGDQVGGYQVFMRVDDPTSLLVEADVDDTQLARLAVGQKVRLEFTDASDASEGTVVQLPDPKARATAPAGQAKRIKVRLEKPSEKAKMGMVGKVHVIMQEKKDVLLLPNAALRRFSNRTYVLLKEPRREVDVVLGIEGETETEILRGPLKEGDVVLGR